MTLITSIADLRPFLGQFVAFTSQDIYFGNSYPLQVESDSLTGAAFIREQEETFANQCVFPQRSPGDLRGHSFNIIFKSDSVCNGCTLMPSVLRAIKPLTIRELTSSEIIALGKALDEKKAKFHLPYTPYDMKAAMEKYFPTKKPEVKEEKK